MASSDEPLDKQTSLKTRLLERLQNPTHLRALVTGLMLLFGYAGVFLPLNGGIEATTRQLAKERTRLELGGEVEKLRKQFAKFKDRLPKPRDPTEWVHYMMDGIRKFPIRQLKLDPEDARDLGPYKAVVMRMELEGTFRDLDSFLEWLETNPRLIRVDYVKIAPQKTGSGLLNMQLVVLGVMG